MKHILLSAVLSAILLVYTGCALYSESEQDVNTLALEYVEQFEYYAPAGLSYAGT